MSKKIKRYFESADDELKNEAAESKTTHGFRAKPVKKESNSELEVIEVNDRETLRGHKWQSKGKRKRLDIPLNPVALLRHSRGDGLNITGVKTNFMKIHEKRKEIYSVYAVEQAARAEVLLNEEDGYLEPDEDEETGEISQQRIVENVDITTAAKHFTLQLDFGPYRSRYTKNGIFLLLGGKRGHVAAFNWVRKKLQCEMNVMESVHDVTWLMNQTMFAVAQKQWVHVYDNHGTELHCLKAMHRITRLEYLPYHFLLNGASDEGYLTWMDVSMGKMIGNYNTRLGKITVMAQNPWNAITCVGNAKGVVSMWCPTVRDPLAKILCHGTPLTAITVDPRGTQLITAGLDRKVKIWDVRQLEGPVVTYGLQTAASGIDISQRGLMALSMGNVCEVYRKPSSEQDNQAPYLRQRSKDTISNVRFCPYEDILGIASESGFTSMIVPGAGEPNFDTFEANPYQSLNQRREEEIHGLLEKIPPEFISLNPGQIGEVDVPSAQQRLEAKVKLLSMKPPKLDFTPRNRNRISKTKALRTKQNMRENKFKEAAKIISDARKRIMEEETQPASADFIPLESKSVLDRFRNKKAKGKK